MDKARSFPYDEGRKDGMPMEIGAKLRQARIAAGLTQEQTAEALGVSRQSISNWENEKNYPDIDILQSISRVMSSIATPEHKELAGRLKNVLATYNEAEDLINIGAYKSGSNRNIDYAIQKIDAVNDFLMQKTDEKFQFEQEIDLLRALFND